jgi:hypothetical protein
MVSLASAENPPAERHRLDEKSHSAFAMAGAGEKQQTVYLRDRPLDQVQGWIEEAWSC